MHLFCLRYLSSLPTFNKIKGFVTTIRSTRRTWYILAALLAACILLPLLLEVKEMVDLDTWLFTENDCTVDRPGKG